MKNEYKSNAGGSRDAAGAEELKDASRSAKAWPTVHATGHTLDNLRRRIARRQGQVLMIARP